MYKHTVTCTILEAVLSNLLCVCVCMCASDKRQRYPRSSPNAQLYAEGGGGGRSSQGPGRTGRRYSGDQKWSDQRHRGSGQDKWRHGRDGLRDDDNVGL